MEISYDPTLNVGYIRFRNTDERVRTLSLSEEVLVDIIADGRIAGIELLNANEQLGFLQDATVTITDESTGKSVCIPLNLWGNGV